VRYKLEKNTHAIKTAAFMMIAALIVFLFSSSLAIATAFSTFIGIFLLLAQRKSESKRSTEIQSACPEIIDHLISGLQSGLSLNESLVGLSLRGPATTRPYFEMFRQDVYSTGDFIGALERVKSELGEPSTDQIIEALLISKTLGGAELITILRLLGNFIREDLTLRREILVKQNWIKNSAHLSAGAPWILLLLLSTQPATAAAFSTFSGVAVLLSGLLMTSVAYLWMNKLGQLPKSSRVFSGNE
jgi:tight adherence protein B